MTARFGVTEGSIPAVKVIERRRNMDSRGFLSRFYCTDELAEIGLTDPIVQINHTLTLRRGTVRGMHYQHPPHAEDKLVSCLRGEVFDIAVDLRVGSPTFLAWHGEILSEGNAKSLLVPKGFAHGFQTLTDDCELIYLHTAAYSPGSDAALNAEDPALAINWPLPVSDMSDRDRQHPHLDKNFPGVAS